MLSEAGEAEIVKFCPAAAFSATNTRLSRQIPKIPRPLRSVIFMASPLREIRQGTLLGQVWLRIFCSKPNKTIQLKQEALTRKREGCYERRGAKNDESGTQSDKNPGKGVLTPLVR